MSWGFSSLPGGSDGKVSACSAGDLGLIPGLGRSPGEGNGPPSPRKLESPKQDKSKVKHPKTHINQINEDQTQRKNIESSNGKRTNKGIPIRMQLIFQ